MPGWVLVRQTIPGGDMVGWMVVPRISGHSVTPHVVSGREIVYNDEPRVFHRENDTFSHAEITFSTPEGYQGDHYIYTAGDPIEHLLELEGMRDLYEMLVRAFTGDDEVELPPTQEERAATVDLSALPTSGSLIAAGGWCAPPESIYSLCEEINRTELQGDWDIATPPLRINRGPTAGSLGLCGPPVARRRDPQPVQYWTCCSHCFDRREEHEHEGTERNRRWDPKVGHHDICLYGCNDSESRDIAF